MRPLRATPPPIQDGPLLLNLGSGPRAVPGWVNLDRSPNVVLSRAPRIKELLGRLGVLRAGQAAPWDPEVIRADIMRLPYADATVDAIYSSHTLEHLYLEDARAVLVESRRVLRPQGVLRLALPDATRLARDLLEDPDPSRAGRRFNERLLAHPAARPGALARLRDMTGGHIHRWQPTPAMVAEMLVEAGFATVKEEGYRSGATPRLDTVEQRPESFFVEAFATAGPD